MGREQGIGFATLHPSHNHTEAGGRAGHKLREQIDKAHDLLNAAEKKFADTTNPLRWRFDQIQIELQVTWGCPQRLTETFPYTELAERLRQTERALTETHAKQPG